MKLFFFTFVFVFQRQGESAELQIRSRNDHLRLLERMGIVHRRDLQVAGKYPWEGKCKRIAVF